MNYLRLYIKSAEDEEPTKGPLLFPLFTKMVHFLKLKVKNKVRTYLNHTHNGLYDTSKNLQNLKRFGIYCPQKGTLL